MDQVTSKELFSVTKSEETGISLGYFAYSAYIRKVAIDKLEIENDRLKAENEQFNSRLTKLEALFNHVNKLIIN